MVSFLQLEWGPCGEKILTATTAPRLRIGNGFKVWHYSGALLHETIWTNGQELLQVVWQKYQDGLFDEKPISNAKVQGIQPSQPQSSKAVYVPPNIRSGGGTAGFGSSPRPNHQPERGPIPGLPIGYKVSQGQRKKDRNEKRKNTENTKQSANSNSNANANKTKDDGDEAQEQNEKTPASNGKLNQRRTPRPNNQSHTNGTEPSSSADVANAYANCNNENTISSPSNEQSITADASDMQNNQDKRRDRRRNRQRKPEGADLEKDKRVRTVQSKLREITKLKVRRDNGDNLEANQLSKIGMEAELIKELNSMKVDA